MDLSINNPMDEQAGTTANHPKELPEQLNLLQAQNRELLLRVKSLEQERNQLLEHVQELEYCIVKANELAVSSDMANLFKTQFLANMSHDIRTPMNGVIGMAKLLRDTTLSSDQQEFTQSIIDSGETLLALINDILDLSKIEAGQVELAPIAFDLPKLLKQQLAPFLMQATKKGITLQFDCDPDVPPYYYEDAPRLIQVINNLVGNAIKFTDRGSVILRIICGEVTLHTATLHFEVRDSGVGISKEAQHVIFDKFKQADSSTTRKYGGTGLGLAISQQLVELMGGHIEVDSIPGVGSRFHFTLQLRLSSRNSVLEESPVIRAAEPTQLVKNSCILLVEDSETNQKVARRVIEKLGHTVDIAENGQEAVDRIRLKNYDLIFMDCQMPVMDGYDATRNIRNYEKNQERNTPIIAMTANVLPAEKSKCLKVGMNDFITKPIDFDQVRSVINSYLQEKITSQVEKKAEKKDSSPSEPILDPDRLLSICGNDTDFIREIVDSFTDDIPHELLLFTQGIDQHDQKNVHASIHKIKGMAANIGAQRLFRLAETIQIACTDDQFSFSASFKDQLISEVDALGNALRTADWDALDENNETSF